MGRALAEAFPVCRQTFAEADEALGESLSRLCYEGPADRLQLTENTQPAILTVSVAAYRALESLGHRASFMAGHSLGEYSAHVAAGTLSFVDAVRIVRRRGRFMQEAVPVGAGAMAAVLGLDAATVAEVCREVAQGEVVAPANLNGPGQVVIAGVRAAVDLLPSMKQSDQILGHCQTIDQLETEADHVMRAAIARMFREEADARQLIKVKEMVELLEEVTDRCEDVANIIEGIVLENA